MVLTLKRWKSRSSPGIEGGETGKPIRIFVASSAGGRIRDLGYRANKARRPVGLAEPCGSVPPQCRQTLLARGGAAR